MHLRVHFSILEDVMKILLLILAFIGLNAKPSTDLFWQALALLLVTIGYVSYAFCEIFNERR